MITKLGNLVEIHAGQSIRNKIDNIANGDYFIIQIKDIDRHIGVNLPSLYKTNMKGKGTPKLVKKGDLLFVPKVFRESLPYSVVVNLDLPNLIVAPTFYTLSVKPSLIRTEYLNWFINSGAHGGKFFKKNAMGSSILNIPKTVLTEMEIIVPPLPVQDNFIKLMAATKKEKEIMDNLCQKRIAFIDEAINQYLN
ncbi:MAG: restriction endonuclease subunit S [Oligoflexia bacterium]|nr:restriction endonuclease subunit S [Oligoflexia bacterium]MBF0365339.1 restriction endonuclease subunit S [Oligoflexia bacterium]